jgi:Spy/CpxP family protein refolding chaperone
VVVLVLVKFKTEFMKSLKLILFTLAMTFSGSVLFAQEATQSAEERATKQTEQMATDLSLNDEQKQKIYMINLGIIQKNDAVRSNDALSSELKTESVKQNDDARIQQIKSVLTPEQNTKFDMIEKMKFENRKVIQKQTIEPRKKN